MANGPTKLIYLTLGIMFLALGVIGLLIPILPGVLFLAGALYMLSRGSMRVKQFADSNETLQGVQRRIDRMEPLSALEKVQVAALETVRAIGVGAQKIGIGVRRLFV